MTDPTPAALREHADKLGHTDCPTYKKSADLLRAAASALEQAERAHDEIARGFNTYQREAEAREARLRELVTRLRLRDEWGHANELEAALRPSGNPTPMT